MSGKLTTPVGPESFSVPTLYFICDLQAKFQVDGLYGYLQRL